MRGAFFDEKLKIRDDCSKPVPGPGEALVRVRLAGICATDLEILKGYSGFAGIPGHEFVGVVESVADLGGELVGQRVVGEINIGCGSCDCCIAGLSNHCRARQVLGIRDKDGCFADYVTLPIANLHPVPSSISDQEAVFIEPLAAAFAVLPHLHTARETEVLVLGDGRLGLLIAQVLKGAGAVVSLVGRHTGKLALARQLGIKAIMSEELAGEKEYQFVVEATGSPAGLVTALQQVRPRGVIVLKSTMAAGVAVDLTSAVVDEITVVGSRCGPFAPALAALAAKRVAVLPLLDTVFPAGQFPAAMARAATPGVLKVLLDFC